MQKIYRCAFAVALVALSASHAYAAPGELKLTISNGRVTIVADQVPVSRILAEWSRIGQTRIVNGERLLTNVSLEVIDWPERKALDLVLRSASGYMAAERKEAVANPSASTFDRIMILPFSKGPANTMPVAAAPAPFSPRPMPQQQPEVDDDQPVVTPPPMQQQPQTQSMPGMPPAPQNVPGQPQQQINPNAPTTLPRPGMLPQTTQPVPFGTPPGAQPKPPGGGGGQA